MPDPVSPLKRSIGLTGLVRWIIAASAVIAVGAAFAAGRRRLAIAGLLFLLLACVVAYRGWQVRR